MIFLTEEKRELFLNVFSDVDNLLSIHSNGLIEMSWILKSNM